MHRTIKLKLDISEEQAQVLFRTMDLYGIAFHFSAEWGFRNHNCNRIDNHKATYHAVRDLYPELPSYFVEGARDYACQCLKSTMFRRLPRMSPRSSIRYHRRAAGVFLRSGYAKLSTVEGRIKVLFNVCEYYKRYIKWTIRSSHLKYDRGLHAFYLCVAVESNEVPEPNHGPAMGIDRGINNIAVTSANQFFSSKAVKNVRGRYTYLRGQLQSKGTRSAKRKLRGMSGRERRFKADVNHRITKEIVNSPYGVFVLEDLKGMNRKKMRKGQGGDWSRAWNDKLSAWNYYQFETFLKYKAEEVGKAVLVVDGRYTSIMCSVCGHKSRGNRQGSTFHCTRCGFQLHSDLNASRNIVQRGISELNRLPVNQPNATSRDAGKETGGGQLQALRRGG